MFVRAKKQAGRAYHYLVIAERQGRRVRQKTVAYLGEYPTLEAALSVLPAEIGRLNAQASKYASEAEQLRARVRPAWVERNGGEVPRRRYKGLALRQDVCQQYWQTRELSELYERRASKLSARLHQLKGFV